jgi:hypothetical protein
VFDLCQQILFLQLRYRFFPKEMELMYTKNVKYTIINPKDLVLELPGFVNYQFGKFKLLLVLEKNDKRFLSSHPAVVALSAQKGLGGIL